MLTFLISSVLLKHRIEEINDCWYSLCYCSKNDLQRDNSKRADVKFSDQIFGIVKYYFPNEETEVVDIHL
jgi:hypothetical protein